MFCYVFKVCKYGLYISASQSYSFIGLNPHQDSPCEILHTYLLGQDKYVWHDTSQKWDKEKEAIFITRLQSSSLDELSLPAV
jgi:hypothetical protein